MIPDAVFTLDKAKAHLRVTHALEDALITATLDAAVAACERVTRRAWTVREWKTAVAACDVYDCCADSPVWHAELSPATAKLFLPASAGPAPLSAPPVEIDPSRYIVTTRFGHTVIAFTGDVPAGLTGDLGYIEWKAEPASVPPDVYAAAMLFLGDLYANRESQVLGTIVAQNALAEMLLRPYVLEMHA